ncbi:hypothetical protein AMS68_005593 [Peltaster fructicola]|uniref:Uncharacterized protein n=1 Tax=Peltaster fructicola TaxID=286661 RepID=A0A6H0XZG6_9PEZI|nr:hypothetical protein AMS68_005593 [Peltaster fructicola]
MDNSGRGKLLQVPGFNDIPLTHELPTAARFAHGINDYAQEIAITARELAMTAVINAITDLPEWVDHILDNDEAPIAAWNAQAFEQHKELMSDQAWNWCLAEVKDKAVEHSEKQFVRVLDTGSCVCKTDVLVNETVSMALTEGLRPLWTPPCPVQRQIIVDPQLYPLIYGTSRVLDHDTIQLPRNALAMDDILLSTSQTMQAEDHSPFELLDEDTITELIEARADERRKGLSTYTRLYDLEPDQYLWSSKYQCLPCDATFTGNDTKVKVTSYVNNLHPSKRGVYKALEELISSSVKLWNECLIHGNAEAHDGSQTGRYPLRIVTFGVQWIDRLPTWARAYMKSHKDMLSRYLDIKSRVVQREIAEGPYSSALTNDDWRMGEYAYMEGVPPAPDPSEETWNLVEGYLGRSIDPAATPEELLERWLEAEADRRRHWIHPETATTFSYEEWKTSCNVDKAIVNMIAQKLRYPPVSWIRGKPTHSRYELHLEDAFRAQGIQIIVKAESIALQPGAEYTGAWQLEGRRNEHIVGVACLMYDVVNANSVISFEQETALNHEKYRFRGSTQYRCTQDDPAAYHYDTLGAYRELDALAQVLGLDSASTLDCFERDENDSMPVQRIGTIKMPQGRLIAFPNVLEYKIQASLIESSSTGHARYVLLYLVDPNYRICSTSNVPPQQCEWWAQSIAALLLKRLPQELVDRVLSYYDYPVSADQAQQHRRGMQKEAMWLEFARHAAMKSFSFDTSST